MISEENSKRITSLRFILTVFVVLIHNLINKEIADESNLIYRNSNFGLYIENIILFFTASAVPLFCLFAGYLQAIKQDSYRVLVQKKTKSLLLPYILWILVYLLFERFLRNCLQSIFTSGSIDFCIHENWTIKEYFYHIIGYSNEVGGAPLVAGQLWFVRNLFIYMMLSPLLILLVKKIPFCFIASVFLFFLSVQFVREGFLTYSLFYYICGLYWGVYDLDLFGEIDKIKWYEIAICFILLFLPPIFNYQIPCYFVLNTLFASLVMLKLSSVFIKNDKCFAITKYLAGYSFFLYAVHFPVINEVAHKVWLHLFPMKNTFFCLFQFFGCAIFIVIIGTLIGILLRKICPPLFALLNGGRK